MVITYWCRQKFDRLVSYLRINKRPLLLRILLFKLILPDTINIHTIIGWAKCIVAHPTKILGGPWPTLQRPHAMAELKRCSEKFLPFIRPISIRLCYGEWLGISHVLSNGVKLVLSLRAMKIVCYDSCTVNSLAFGKFKILTRIAGQCVLSTCISHVFSLLT